MGCNGETVLHLARERGVNLFDNAETYGQPMGEAERVMGEAITQLQQESPELWRRSELVLTTKIFWGGTGVNERGLSRKHMREGLLASLERLQTEYVDLVFCHRPDPYTPTETVVRGMTDLVRGGLATAWGTSDGPRNGSQKPFGSRGYGLEPPQFERPQYNMFHRSRVEEEYHPLMHSHIPWVRPFGVRPRYSGKYNDAIPELSDDPRAMIASGCWRGTTPMGTSRRCALTDMPRHT